MLKEAVNESPPLKVEETVPIEVKDIPKLVGAFQHTLTELTRSGKFNAITERVEMVYKSGSFLISIKVMTDKYSHY